MEKFDQIAEQAAQFRDERDWAQFHSPKNLVMALSGEAGELIEHFQWLTEAQSRELTGEKLQAVAEEMADVQVYLMLLAEQLKINLLDACAAKIEKNKAKYPVEKSRGRATKYTELR